MSTAPVPTTVEIPQRLWGLFLIVGALLILLGLFAMIAPWIAGLVTVMLYGILFLISGAAHAVAVFQARNWNGVILHLLMAVLALVVGFFCVMDTHTALNAITMVLALFFMVGGLFRIMASFMIRSRNWLLYLLSGVVSLLLGVLVWDRLPDDSDWVLGTFVGIELLFEGVSAITLALAIRGKAA
jgi:uncharacterized membrane protein HdeD (DUF308 family)